MPLSVLRQCNRTVKRKQGKWRRRSNKMFRSPCMTAQQCVFVRMKRPCNRSRVWEVERGQLPWMKYFASSSWNLRRRCDFASETTRMEGWAASPGDRSQRSGEAERNGGLSAARICCSGCSFFGMSTSSFGTPANLDQHNTSLPGAAFELWITVQGRSEVDCSLFTGVSSLQL